MRLLRAREPTIRRSVTIAGVGALAAAALLAGCASYDDEAATQPNPTATDVRGESPSTVGLPDPSPTAVEGRDRVPAPGGGDIDEVDSTGADTAIEIAPAVGIDAKATVAGGLVVSVVDVEAGEVEGVAPGEVSGPAIVVTVSVTNDTSTPVDLGSSFVSLSYADGQLAAPAPSAEWEQLSGDLVPGQTAGGKYAFRTIETDLDAITVLVSPAAGLPVAQFAGNGFQETS